MSDQKDEQALEEYLKGNSPLSQQYRSESTEQPPARLDAEIIAAAKAATGSKAPEGGPISSRWYVPLSLAALVVICFSVVFKIYDEELMPVANKQKAEEFDAVESFKDDNTGYSVGESAERTSDEDRMTGESIGNEAGRRLLRKQEAVPSAPALRKDTDQDAYRAEPEGKIYEQPALDVPAEPDREFSSQEILQEKSEIASEAVISDKLQPRQWFELINQLWFEGDKTGAYDALNKFLSVYPDYSREELKQQLPAGMGIPESIR